MSSGIFQKAGLLELSVAVADEVCDLGHRGVATSEGGCVNGHVGREGADGVWRIVRAEKGAFSLIEARDEGETLSLVKQIARPVGRGDRCSLEEGALLRSVFCDGGRREDKQGRSKIEEQRPCEEAGRANGGEALLHRPTEIRPQGLGSV